MSAHEFVRRLKRQAGEQDRHYAFWLGAGCSVTSGIPAAASLVKEKWLPELYRVKAPQDLALEEWAAATFEGYDSEQPAALYGPLMGELFRLPDDKQRETERLCEGRVPGFGYAVLASLMSRSDGIFSAALTTNFDDLIADSMYVFGERRPLVIQHGALAGFVRPGRVRRPLVVKVHGDHRLNPMHTREETSKLEEGIQRSVQGLLHDRGVIFIGYAGNDNGVIDALKSLPVEAVPLGVWWVSRQEPKSAIREWLETRDATWVEASGFDELMLLFHKEFEIEHPTVRKFEEMIKSYQDTYKSLETRVGELPDSAPDSGALKEASRRARETADDWWKVELEAAQVKESDPDLADRIYREGVERLRDHRLLGNYALFLTDPRKDYDAA
ncbi:MAG TPA: SIR2 family protein, partial [Solirubrobacterales bacterium]|nr:SIR2 family protein [Solirubrobacterales bacterium]